MVDLVKLHIKAGNGGDGRVSFRREKFIPKGGPDGGDGGDGGSVLLRGNRNFHSLRDFSGVHEIEAKDGQVGGRHKSFGSKASDVIVDVPLGTRVWKIVDAFVPHKHKRMYWVDRDEGRQERALSSRRKQSPTKIIEQDGVFALAKDIRGRSEEGKHPESSIEHLQVGNTTYAVTLVGEVTEDSQELNIVSGGRGGKGNWWFRSSTNTTPREAETGETGESGEFILELQVLADVGFIGYPNVGKSTLLSVLTNASPKVANYPFTTLEPNLGVLEYPSDNPQKRQSLQIADIPGIIAGASQGKGLGLEFLRHIHRCKVYVFVLSLEDQVMIEHAHEPKTLVKELEEQYEILEEELKAYKEQLLAKERVIVINKSDLLSPTQQDKLLLVAQKKFENVFLISAKTGKGIDLLKQHLRAFV